MNTIDSIAPNNSLLIRQKQSLNILINILVNNDIDLNEYRLKFVSIILLVISIKYNLVELLRWLVESNHCLVNDLINNNHINLANQLGFNIELLDNSGTQSPNSVSQY